MQNEKTKVLTMLSEGKISVEEAERLLVALVGSSKQDRNEAEQMGMKKAPLKFLYILVDSKNEEQQRVKIKIPLRLLRAGIKLANLIPKDKQASIQDAMHHKGIEFSLNEINAENVEDIIESLQDLEVTVNDDETIRIFCA